MFRKEIGDVTFVELFNDEDDKPRGCGILEFATADLAKKAIDTMHRHELRGRKLVVKEDFDTERDAYGRILSEQRRNNRERNNTSPRRDRSSRRRSRERDSHSSRSSNNNRSGSNVRRGGANDYGENTFGLSATFLESLGIDGPLLNRVFVANLSYTVDERKLKDVFRLAGKVCTVDLNRDKNGKSRGFGVVEYNHPVEAVQAISMFNDQMLYDRRMTVRFDNQAPEDDEEILPSRLPEGLGGVGMGLGSGGHPLLDVANNLPTSGSNNSNAALANNVMSAFGNNSAASNMGGNNPDNSAVTAAMNMEIMSNVAKLVNTMGFLTNSNNQNNPGPSNNMGGGGGGGGAGGQMGNMNANNMGPPNNMGGGNNPMGGNMGNNMGGRNIGGYSTGNSGYPSNNGGNMGGNMNNDMMNPGGNMSGPPDVRGDMGGNGGGNNLPTMPPPPHLSDSIIIRNLPIDCNWQALRDGFSHCGDIKYAEMKERTTGLIRFTSDRDAERAVSMMNKHVIGNRTISVQLY